MTDETTTRTKDLIPQIIAALKATGGLTSDELALRIGTDVKNIRPRLTELKKLKRIFVTGDRRRNAKGRNPKVVSLTETANA